MERKDDGTLLVYDFIDNTQTAPDNLILSTAANLEITASPDGTALLLVERNREDGAMVKLSVLDMSGNCFFKIDSDSSAVGSGNQADWFDNNTALVGNNANDMSRSSTGDSWYYLYNIVREN